MLVDKSLPSNFDRSLKSLARHIAEIHWREVFLLAIGMLSDASYLLTLMKNEIDMMIAGDPQVQDILNWVNQCANNTKVSYKKAAVRAFYLKYSYDIALANAQLNLDQITEVKDVMTHVLDSEISLELIEETSFLGSRLHEANSRFRDRRDDHQFAIDVSNNTDDRVFTFLAIPDLQQLKEQIPTSKEGESFRRWWSKSGRNWNQSLSQLANHQNINHSFKFNAEQEKSFRRYYNANAFLIECLYSDCVVEVSIRKRIEEGLFRPLSILEESEDVLIGEEGFIEKENTDNHQATIRERWSKTNKQI